MEKNRNLCQQRMQDSCLFASEDYLFYLEHAN